jgi:lipopolysaccharide transport system permease protein
MHVTKPRVLELVGFQVYADLRSESERTYVGFLWWVIDPIVSMAVYYLVFKVIFQRGEPGFVAFLFVGLVTWRWMTATVSRGSKSILQGASLMNQVYLPKIILPTVSILSDTVKFGIVFMLLLGFLGITGHAPSEAYLVLPVLLVTEFLLIIALTLLFAAVVPFLPDIQMTLDHVFRLLFFLSGVFYSIARIPEQLQPWMRINPMATLIEGYRAVLLEAQLPQWGPLLAVALVSLAGVLLGAALIARNDRVYPKLA